MVSSLHALLPEEPPIAGLVELELELELTSKGAELAGDDIVHVEVTAGLDLTAPHAVRELSAWGEHRHDAFLGRDPERRDRDRRLSRPVGEHCDLKVAQIAAALLES